MSIQQRVRCIRKTRDEVQKLIATSSDICAMKDRDSVFLQANARYARLVGFKHAQDFIGRTDFDLPSQSFRFASLFQAQDQEVLASFAPMRILDIHPFCNQEWKALLVVKSIFYEENGHVGGTFFTGQDITSRAALQFSMVLDHTSPNIKEDKVVGHFSYALSPISQKPFLTERQEHILFFLMRRYSLKKIALALHISLRTVYSEIEKLRLDFKASNMSELIDNAIAAGCTSTIPTSLSWCQMSVVLRDDVL